MLCLVFTNGEIKTQIKWWLGWRRVRPDLDIQHYLSGELDPSICKAVRDGDL